MHALSISLGWIYKSENIAEVTRDNSSYYDDQGLGIITTHLKILHALKVLPNTFRI